MKSLQKEMKILQNQFKESTWHTNHKPKTVQCTCIYGEVAKLYVDNMDFENWIENVHYAVHYMNASEGADQVHLPDLNRKCQK